MIREILGKCGYDKLMGTEVGIVPSCLSGRERDALVKKLEALGWKTKKITLKHNVMQCPDRHYNSMINDWVCPHGSESYSVAFWNPTDTDEPVDEMSVDSTQFERVTDWEV